MLLERDDLLEQLLAAIAAATRGDGALVLVAGEAGAGKSALVGALADAAADALVLVGACDPLSTPRPLSPLYDFAADPLGGLDDLPLGDADNLVVFNQVLDRLRHSIRPILLVLEDVHWADDATLDFIRFIGRRVADSKAVVVCTYRDDEVGPSHPLRPVLGQLIPLAGTRRLAVPMLSREAVGALAEGSGLDVDELVAATSGNAFFVTEVIASGESVPASVQDAVLARFATLGDGARHIAEAVAIAPRSLEIDRAVSLVGGVTVDIDEAVAAGVILGDRADLRFRHELARAAVEQSMPPARRHGLHRSMLTLLLDEQPVDHARVAHHAGAAHAPDLIVEHAPHAGRAAVRQGARREAIDFFRSTLEHDHLLAPDDAAAIRRQLADQLRFVDMPQESLAEIDGVIRHYRATQNHQLLADALWIRQGNLWNLGRLDEGWDAGLEAVEILRPLGPSHDLGMAFGRLGYNHMLARRSGEAAAAADEASAVAEEIDDREVRRLAEIVRACVQIISGDGHRGLESLRRIRETAAVERDRQTEVSVLGLMGTGGGEARIYSGGLEALDNAIALGAAADDDSGVLYNRSWKARIAFEQGRWQDAVDLAEHTIESSAREDGVAVLTALGVLGRVRVRRGDPGGSSALHEVLELGTTNELQHMWPSHCGLAEFHWLHGDTDSMVVQLESAYRRALETGSVWARGEIGFWMWRAGAIEEPPADAAEPFVLQMDGDWRGAAQAWREIGCPYEMGLALTDGDTDALLEALGIFQDLGAKPMHDRVRARLRERGVDSVPRGPIRSTVRNMAGLTNRQLEVYQLMVRGQSNGEIAEALYVSKKTVEHHVSAIFTKLGVDSRAKAIARANDPQI